MTFCYQDAVLDHIKRVRHNSIGADPAVLKRSKLADEALASAASRRPIHKVFCGVFASAPTTEELDDRTGSILAKLTAHGLKPIAPQNDPIAQDSYVRALPFNYDPVQDGPMVCQNVRGCGTWITSPAFCRFFGRSVGTGNPGVIHYNRSAEPLAFDPLHVEDRRKNAHSLILGPTGSGKTSLLISQLLHMMAMRKAPTVPDHRPSDFRSSGGLLRGERTKRGSKGHRCRRNSNPATVRRRIEAVAGVGNSRIARRTGRADARPVGRDGNPGSTHGHRWSRKRGTAPDERRPGPASNRDHRGGAGDQGGRTGP